MNEITVLTPTYQRINCLPKLYKSLCHQECKDFVWMVIDDGSTDGTKETVEKWINEKKIDIIYIYKENGGKNTAINLAMKYINTKLTFIVDSDDWLTKDSISTIYRYYYKYSGYSDLCGFSFLRLFPNGKPNGPLFKKNNWICSFFESRVLNNNGGDKAEIWYSDCLKKYPFPEYKGEKYYPEDGLWIRISGNKKMVHVNKGIYIGDYLEGGITDSNISKRMKRWPKGMVDRSYRYLKLPCRPKTLIKMQMLYIIYGVFGGGYNVKLLFKKCPHKFLFILAFIPSIIIGFYYSHI